MQTRHIPSVDELAALRRSVLYSVYNTVKKHDPDGKKTGKLLRIDPTHALKKADPNYRHSLTIVDFYGVCLATQSTDLVVDLCASFGIAVQQEGGFPSEERTIFAYETVKQQYVYEVSKELQKVVIDGPYKSKWIASRIGKAYPTLMRQCNPYDSGTIASLDTACAIMCLCQGFNALELIAKRLNFKIVGYSHELSD